MFDFSFVSKLITNFYLNVIPRDVIEQSLHGRVEDLHEDLLGAFRVIEHGHRQLSVGRGNV